MQNSGAKNFLFDRENQFFDYVADRMGYEPAALRQRIKQAMREKRDNGYQYINKI